MDVVRLQLVDMEDRRYLLVPPQGRDTEVPVRCSSPCPCNRFWAHIVQNEDVVAVEGVRRIPMIMIPNEGSNSHNQRHVPNPIASRLCGHCVPDDCAIIVEAGGQVGIDSKGAMVWLPTMLR